MSMIYKVWMRGPEFQIAVRDLEKELPKWLMDSRDDWMCDKWLESLQLIKAAVPIVEWVNENNYTVTTPRGPDGYQDCQLQISFSCSDSEESHSVNGFKHVGVIFFHNEADAVKFKLTMSDTFPITAMDCDLLKEYS